MPEHIRRSRVGYAISSVDGTPLYYDLSAPKPEQPLPIVLCDGIGCDGFIWKYLKPQLMEKYQVLRWHYRGHGRSPKPNDPERLGMDDLADDLASVLDDADVDDAILIGHSMGVQVSLEFHRRHRYRSKALILICGAHSEPLKTFKGSDFLDLALPTVRKAISKAPGLFSSIGRAFLPRDWVYRFAAKYEFEERFLSHQDFMPYLKSLAQMDPVLFLSMLSKMAEHSALEFLEDIRVPALLISGELDSFTPPQLSLEMSEKIQGAEYFEVKNGTHSAPLEHPDIVGEIAMDFLDRLPSPLGS